MFPGRRRAPRRDQPAPAFHAGFAVSAALVLVSLITAATLLREDGRGQRINLLELQTGS